MDELEYEVNRMRLKELEGAIEARKEALRQGADDKVHLREHRDAMARIERERSEKYAEEAASAQSHRSFIENKAEEDAVRLAEFLRTDKQQVIATLLVCLAICAHAVGPWIAKLF